VARKKWSARTEITPAVLKFREKRKWQIALRRYVIEKNNCITYAPYFGLDRENLRKWFEMQFEEGIGWGDFGSKWQFNHIIPVTFFDFSDETELKMCWNFVNIRVDNFQKQKENANIFNTLAAKRYFEDIYNTTQYINAKKLLDKIKQIQQSEVVISEKQQTFITEYKTYLEMIESYSAFEFELLNSGRPVDEVIKEIAFFKKKEN
jgi:hypothetical protein